MSQLIGLDVRLPLGWMFAIMGVLLCLQGLLSGSAPQGATPNINLWWGVALLVFGAVMLWLARRGKVRATGSVGSSSGGV
jgi:hypothetical protein